MLQGVKMKEFLLLKRVKNCSRYKVYACDFDGEKIKNLNPLSADLPSKPFKDMTVGLECFYGHVSIFKN